MQGFFASFCTGLATLRRNSRHTAALANHHNRSPSSCAALPPHRRSRSPTNRRRSPLADAEQARPVSVAVQVASPAGPVLPVHAKLANVARTPGFQGHDRRPEREQQVLVLPALLLASTARYVFPAPCLRNCAKSSLRGSHNAQCGASLWKSFATCTNCRCAFTCIETGGVSRDIERGSRSISNLISYALYSILPTLVEIGLVLAILLCSLRQHLRPDYPGFAGRLRRVHGQGQQLANRHQTKSQRRPTRPPTRAPSIA
jgi:hypothetical protein